MDEFAIREMIREVKAGRLSRRRFIQTMIGLGLTGPMAAQMLAAAGVHAQPKTSPFTPNRRGGGGPLRVFLWRNGVSASSLRLHGMDLSGWETTFWRLPYWYKT